MTSPGLRRNALTVDAVAISADGQAVVIETPAADLDRDVIAMAATLRAATQAFRRLRGAVDRR